MQETQVELLRAFPLLRGLPPEELASIPATRVERGRGDAFFEQDSSADYVFGILSGHVRILRQSPAGREVCMEFLGPGDLFAAVAVMKNIRMPAAAKASERASALRIPATDFRRLVALHPELVGRVFEVVSDRLVNSVETRLGLATERVEMRLAQALLRLAEKYADPRGDELVFGTPITRQQLADLAGTTVESAIRVMSRWSRDGLVRSASSRITIADAEELKRVAGRAQDSEET